MRKRYLLSLMLMGIMSLLTSCVDGDYYELYDDYEDVSFSRNKRGKEAPNAMLDFEIYPLMNDGCAEYNGWFGAECAACFYSKMTGCDKVTARMEMILTKYGCFNGESYGAYFYAVMNGIGSGNLITPNQLAGSLGMQLMTREEFVNAVRRGSLCTSSWGVVYYGVSHIARVYDYHIYPSKDHGTIIEIDTEDQEGLNFGACQVFINSNGFIDTDRSDVDCFIAP